MALLWFFSSVTVVSFYDWDEASEVLVFHPLPPPHTTEVQPLVDAITETLKHTD